MSVGVGITESPRCIILLLTEMLFTLSVCLVSCQMTSKLVALVLSKSVLLWPCETSGCKRTGLEIYCMYTTTLQHPHCTQTENTTHSDSEDSGLRSASRSCSTYLYRVVPRQHLVTEPSVTIQSWLNGCGSRVR